ncbi:MAG: hypothetical protein VB025_08590 [Sphaerochaeta sp.]|nr:hypothetical protein [Sphaerochaeta sp.]
MKTSSTHHLVALALAVLLMVSLGCTTTGNLPHSESSDSSRVADLKALYTTLPAKHKDFFNTVDRTEFEAACMQALAHVDSMSDADFYFTLRTLAAYAHDSHTSVGMTQSLVDQFLAIPVQITYLQDAWRISVVDKHRSDLLGAEIVAVNGIPMDEVIDRATSAFSHDNTVWLRKSLSQQLNLTQLYSFLGIAAHPTDPIDLTLIPIGDDTEQTLTLEPVTAAQFHQRPLATLYDKTVETGPSKEPYRSLLLQGHDTLFIQYNQCMSVDAFPLPMFIGEVLAQIAEQKPSRIIVDLRYNGGGDSRLFEPMIDGLATLQAKQSFALDVLIGEGTFSSALMNAIQFKRRTDCLLVGSPTGGSVNHYGETARFLLPYSNLPVIYSTKRFVMDASHPAGPLLPDLSVEPTVQQLLTGSDAAVDAVLGL